MILALSDAGWTTAGVLVVQAFAFVGLFVRQGRTRDEVAQVNRAVNHQPTGSPTLVERVGSIEDIGSIHRQWVYGAFETIATQVGCQLKPHPQEDPDG